MKKTLLLSCLLLAVPNFTPAQEAKHPRYLLVVQGELPSYPTLAKTARVSGRVRVQVTVKDGEVVSTKVASGNPLLSSAATANIKTWKFDRTTNATFTTTFIYKLETEEGPEASNPRIELQLPTMVRITAKPTRRPCHDCGADIVPKPVERTGGPGL